MVHLFLSDALAADLRRHVAGVPGLEGVVLELDAELGHLERRPFDCLPALSVWYRGDAVDYYADAVADAVHAAVQAALAGLAPAVVQAASKPSTSAPLFAALDDDLEVDEGKS